MSNFPRSLSETNLVVPAPRRVRGIAGGATVFDTTRALYVWEWPHYPQYYIPQADVRMESFAAVGEPFATPQGEAQTYVMGEKTAGRRPTARLILTSPIEVVCGRLRFEWDTLDRWFEEDEEIFVHPRSPYTRVDALRSTRHIRVELDGVLLVESSAPVMVFETGLPTRYYVDQGDVRFEHLVPSETRTECPYKGRTTGYWSVRIGQTLYPDVAWTYSFPTRQVLPIAGLVAFLNENVDMSIDGRTLPRPKTHMGKS